MSQHKTIRTPTSNDLLIKGLVLFLIGLTMLLAPRLLAATPLLTLFAQAQAVAWFALVLGTAFIGRHFFYQFKQQRSQQR